MGAINVVMTSQEIAEIDHLINLGFSKSRADLVRKATLEFCIRCGLKIPLSDTTSGDMPSDPG